MTPSAESKEIKIEVSKINTPNSLIQGDKKEELETPDVTIAGTGLL